MQQALLPKPGQCVLPAHFPKHCSILPATRPTRTPKRPATHHRRQLQCSAAANIVENIIPFQSYLQQDVCAAAFAAVGAYAWVKMFDKLAGMRVMDQKLSRKLVHLSAGPLFILTWVLFSPEPYSRYLAALVPCLQGLRLMAVGTGMIDSPNTVRAVSREGDRTELLRGPLYYVLVLVAITAFYWRDSPLGLVALSLMCGGDGLADIIGRRFGTNNKLPYNPSKSVAGSFAMFAGGFAMSMLLIWLFASLGYFDCDLYTTAAAVAVVSLLATAIESLPINKDVDDNLSVPGIALLAGVLLVRSAEML